MKQGANLKKENMQMKKFSKIGKLSTALKALISTYQYTGLDENNAPMYNESIELPVVKLYGTVKLHGTNAAVAQNPEGKLQFQSRTNIITPESDNAGFAFWASQNTEELSKMINFYRKQHEIDENHTVVVYGEWAGKGIQKNVGINELPKAFYVFAIAVITDDLENENSNFYLDMSKEFHWVNKEARIFNLWDKEMFPVYEIEMDLNNPKLVQNDLIKITDDIEEECPVAKAFGVSGIGEGAVWVNSTNKFRAKIKGDKHAGKTKVSKTNIVDLEKLNSVNEFVERFVDIERLEQGWNMMTELGHALESKTIGHFIRWVIDDVISEESDTLMESGLEPKDVKKLISNKARKYFIGRLDSI